jgi:hypothetical protein
MCLIALVATATPVRAQLQEATRKARDDAQKVVQANKALLQNIKDLNKARVDLVASLTEVVNLLPEGSYGGPPPLVPICVTECIRGCFGRCRTIQRVIWVPEDQVVPKKYGESPQTIRRKIREELEQIRDTLVDPQLSQAPRAAEFLELNLQAVGLLTLIQRLQLQ